MNSTSPPSTVDLVIRSNGIVFAVPKKRYLDDIMDEIAKEDNAPVDPNLVR